MSDDLGFLHDHAEIAWSHFLAQHVGKLNTENFVRAFYQPINILDKALNDLYTKRWIETAEGEQLDGIGSIVGIGRTVANYSSIPFFGFIHQIAGRAFGTARMRHKGEAYLISKALSDDEYRTFIQLKIALNNGHGTAEELMYSFNTELGITKTRVDDVGNANARIYLDDFNIASDVRSTLLDTMIPKAAGVKLWPYYYDADTIFGFSNQHMGYFGFGIGILTQSIKSIVIKGQRPEPSTKPNLILDFMSPGALDPRIVFTRGSNATYRDANNIVKTVSGNTPRWDFDPITRRLRGLLIEEQRTNILPNYTWGQADVVITGNVGLAPDGTNDAYRIAEVNTLNFHYTNHNLSVTPSTPHVFSVYAKAQEVRYLQLTFDGTGGSCYATFDLQTGTVTEVGNSGFRNIQSAANGFYRCSVGATFREGTDVRIMMMLSNSPTPGIFPNYQGNPAKGLLCWCAQFEDGPAISSPIPTTTVAVTRATEICQMPIEGWFNNVYSLQTEYIPARDTPYCGISDNGFDDNTSYFMSGGWTKIGTGGGVAYGSTPITFNQINKQIGTYTSALGGEWKCSNNGGGAGHASGNATAQSGALRLSIGCDPWGLTSQMNGYMRAINFWPRILSDDEMMQVTAPDLGPSLDLDFMKPGQLDSRIVFTRASGATYTDSNGVIKAVTNNQPRWDYDPITKQLKGMMIEEGRTNIIFPSVPATGWNPSAVNMVPNSGTAPDGTNSFVKMVNTTDNSFHGIQYGFNGVANATYTVSIYAKAAEIRYLQLMFDDLVGFALWATFDLQTGTITQNAGVTAPFMVYVGNGIYRCGFTATFNSAQTVARFAVNNCDRSYPGFFDPPYPGNGIDGTYIWGAQVEQYAPFVTSYIPTTTAAVTRAQDSCMVPNTGWWFASPGGSWFAEFINNHFTSGYQRIISIPPGPANGGPAMTSDFQTFAQYDSVIQYTNNTFAANTVAKMISTISGLTGKLCGNGGPISNGAMAGGYSPILTNGVQLLAVAPPGSKENMTGYIRHVSYWPRILSDAEMIEMTKVTP